MMSKYYCKKTEGEMIENFLEISKSIKSSNFANDQYLTKMIILTMTASLIEHNLIDSFKRVDSSFSNIR